MARSRMQSNACSIKLPRFGACCEIPEPTHSANSPFSTARAIEANSALNFASTSRTEIWFAVGPSATSPPFYSISVTPRIDNTFQRRIVQCGKSWFSSFLGRQLYAAHAQNPTFCRRPRVCCSWGAKRMASFGRRRKHPNGDNVVESRRRFSCLLRGAARPASRERFPSETCHRWRGACPASA